MANKSLMSAVVRIRPDLTEFRKEMQSAGKTTAEGLQTQLGQAGENAGKEFGQKFTRDANGRLRDERGKFVKVGTETGEALGEGIAKGAEGSLGQLSARLNKSFGSMQSLGMKMSLAITTPLTVFAKKSLQNFSDFEDASSAASVFYGDQVKEIEKFSQTSAVAFGMSKTSAYELANALAPLIGQFVASDKSGMAAAEAMARTADMASFFGGSVEDAAGAVQSFLSGSSTEPIRRYGVFASEAAVAAKALELGLVKANVSSVDLGAAQTGLARAQEKVVKLARDGKMGSLEYTAALDGVALAEQRITKLLEGKTPELTDAMKIQARYAIVMEQTDQASGDFVRTSDSLANSTKAAGAQLDDASVVIGEKLAPKMILLQEHMLKVLEKFSSLPEGTQNFIVMAAAVAAIAGPMLMVIGTIGKMGVALVGLAAKWLGVSAAARTAAASQAAAGAAGAGAGAGAAGAAAAGAAAAAAAVAGTYLGGKGGQALYDNNKGYQNFIDGVVDTAYIGDAMVNIGGWMSKLPGLADGGTITGKGSVLVGERGPEMLSLPVGASVRPLGASESVYITNHVSVTGKAADDPALLAKELDRLSRRTAATVSKRKIV